MLIDASFFRGEISLANTEKLPVREAINYMIAYREREILVDFLGHELYAEFMQGLTETTIPKKWMQLLYGDGRTWAGLIRQRIGGTTLATGEPITVTADATGAAITVPAGLPGTNRVLSQNGVSFFEGTDFTITGTTLTATSTTFTAGEKLGLLSVVAAEGAAEYNRQSLIANYVYYFYCEKEATQTVALGQVVTNAENAERANPVDKMVRAWNEMVDWLHELCEFLKSNRNVYPNWKTVYCKMQSCGCGNVRNKYDYINSLDL